MKNIKVIGYGLMVMGALLLSVPATAQNAQEWQSTSVMQTSGSSYSPQVTEIGATTVTSAATTTESYSPANTPSGPRRVIGTNSDGGEGSNDSPVGDAMLPLMLMAVVFGGAVAFRRRREA